jgi:hypothetical protein
MVFLMTQLKNQFRITHDNPGRICSDKGVCVWQGKASYLKHACAAQHYFKLIFGCLSQKHN